MQINLFKVGAAVETVTLDEGTTVGTFFTQLESQPGYQGLFQKFLSSPSRGYSAALISSFGEPNLETVLMEGDSVSLSPKIESGR